MAEGLVILTLLTVAVLFYATMRLIGQIADEFF